MKLLRKIEVKRVVSDSVGRDDSDFTESAREILMGSKAKREVDQDVNIAGQKKLNGAGGWRKGATEVETKWHATRAWTDPAKRTTRSLRSGRLDRFRFKDNEASSSRNEGR